MFRVKRPCEHLLLLRNHLVWPHLIRAIYFHGHLWIASLVDVILSVEYLGEPTVSYQLLLTFLVVDLSLELLIYDLLVSPLLRKLIAPFVRRLSRTGIGRGVDDFGL
jgi:hypothetical protein